MRTLAIGALLLAGLLGPATARALSPALPPTPYTSQELADLNSKAEAGDAVAQDTLGEAYLYGLRTGKDTDLGRHWLTLAAAQQNGAAEKALGFVYLGGFGVAPNKPAALEWFTRAASHGYRDSWATELAQQRSYYLKLQAAAQTGDAAAEYAFAEYLPLQKPDSGGRDWGDDDGLKWYRLSAQQGYAPAEAWMGSYYLMGYVRDKSGPTAPHAAWEADGSENFNAAMSADWYEKAAAQGNGEAIHVLPALYAMTRDYDVALIEAKMRAAAWLDLPAGKNMEGNEGRGQNYYDLRELCAWYDGQTIAWRYSNRPVNTVTIRGKPQPPKALECYKHQADLGVQTGMYVVAYRTQQSTPSDMRQAAIYYRKVWDKVDANAGLGTRAAAHIGLMAASRHDLVPAYVWLTIAARGDLTADDPDTDDTGVPYEPDLSGQVKKALSRLKLTPAQKADGDRQIGTILHALPPPSPPPEIPRIPLY